ncbi:DUF4232 domain-containing protein [Actinacidiphila acidipaludis]|uniref:DUF4232 domain-containing protein n=1 Tax=Actinacidiphila acidipaludis TaxID=2873382 RepID=A0ABS7Q5E1_9ACTN|nr:DUF4232 domain-containing protein [Streptomyces acidipaludis]MBY8878378.1 DUF4232 domain-containing protein [Streptomyces acidipaludis]
MRSSSLAAGAAAVAVAALGVVPATASAAAPVRDTSGTPMCATSQLTASLGDSEGAAGSLFRNLVLTNHSATACHLTGFPGVSLLDGGGKQIGLPATREHEGYRSVVLRPGGTASDTIHTINHMGGCLPTSASLRVYPPGNRASLVVPAKIANCDNLFTITPLAASSAGNPVGSGPTGGSTPTPSPTSSGRQVTAVPSGAPDTGLAASSSGGTGGAAVALVAGGVVVAGGLGAAAARRRRSQARARG